jgi:hypothetical protein
MDLRVAPPRALDFDFEAEDLEDADFVESRLGEADRAVGFFEDFDDVDDFDDLLDDLPDDLDVLDALLPPRADERVELFLLDLPDDFLAIDPPKDVMSYQHSAKGGEKSMRWRQG